MSKAALARKVRLERALRNSPQLKAWLDLRNSQEARLLEAGVPLSVIVTLGKDAIAEAVAKLET